ncbi:stress-activated map kinase interacting protein 1-domain-containing protein [Coemansia spiralis]|nr:stress-activated map kinase interacting protein 1-domain-containing protein [Coemansia spiralis]
MALVNDSSFLIYQLRVAFLRSNDPTGERILTFGDLSVPPTTGNGLRTRQGSAPSPMTPTGRRNTSASEIRQQVAQNAAANPYIMACGYYPETEAVGSPEIQYDEGYMYSRPTPRLAYTAGGARSQDGADMPPPSARYPDGVNGSGRNKRTNRNAKVAPTTEGREEVVGLGVIPQNPEMLISEIMQQQAEQPPISRRSLDTVRSRPLAIVEEVADSGSLSDGGGVCGQTKDTGDQDWMPKPIVVPPRRSLDTINHRADKDTQFQSMRKPTAAERRRQQGHAYSNSMATIRLQRPAEMLRKGSSRDAIALGIDFDVKSMFEKGDQGTRSIYDLQYQQAQQQQISKITLDSDHKLSPSRPKLSDGSVDTLKADNPKQMPLQDSQQQQSEREQATFQFPKKLAGNIELRAKRGDMSFKIPLTSLRDDRSSSNNNSNSSITPLLKRSATLPTKRHGSGGSVSSNNSTATTGPGQKSKWVGAYALGRKRQQVTNQASGWVGGAQDTSWDHSSDEEDDAVPLSRRGGGTQTWYGPRSGFRPISMFPPPKANPQYPIPPVPLMFGANDSDDDIDLEGDEGSSRTPALIGLGFGRGLNSQMDSPNPSLRSRRESTSIFMDKPRINKPTSKHSSALATSVPVSSPLSTTLAPSAVSGGKYDYLTQDASGLRPRGISDPEGRQSSRGSKLQLGSGWNAFGDLYTSPNSTKDDSQLASILSPAARQDALNPTSSNGPLLSSRGLGFGLDGASSTASSRHGQPDMSDGNAVIAKYVPPAAPKSSGLAALLSSQVEVRMNPFSEEFSSVGGGAGNSNTNNSLLEVKLQFIQYGDQKSAPLTINVRRAANVEQTIGHALYQYIEGDCQPRLGGDVQDVVMWVMRMVEDGEVDDDLPALDRTRPVVNFAFDDLALCLATPEQVKQNEAVRERLGKPPRMARPKSLMPPTPATSKPQTGSDTAASKADLRNKALPRPERTAVVLQVSRIAMASMAGIFVGNALLDRKASLLPPMVKGSLSSQSISQEVSATALCEPRLLKIRILGEAKSAEESLRATTVETDTDATMGMVLAQVCRKKPFSEERYVLGMVEGSEFAACDSEMRVAQLPPGAELCLLKVGSELPPLEAIAEAQRSELAPIYGQQWAAEGSTGSLLDESGEANMSSVYYTFRVFRRAQMFTRHERSLVIDGDVVTLMPSGHRTESAKTLTFHVSNIICKRNQKSPRKIRLFITRRGNTGEKSIDLEAMSEEDASNICTILTRLHEYYASNDM